MKAHALVLTFFLLPAAAQAEDSTGKPPPFEVEWQPPVDLPTYGKYVGEPGIPPEVLTEGFLADHPDIRWRREGLHSFTNKQYDRAMQQFLRAARYADKPAQAMIAEMYWTGTGVPQDRALGYAWMDLAAERYYSNFIIKREHYWGHLSPAEQADAVVRGQPLLAQYGDDVAKERMAGKLRKQRLMTGSRVGFVGPIRIYTFVGPGQGTGYLGGDDFYKRDYWRPESYFKFQDRMWHAPPPNEGEVEVGEVEQASQAPEPAPSSTP
jgi:hypothetical protein